MSFPRQSLCSCLETISGNLWMATVLRKDDQFRTWIDMIKRYLKQILLKPPVVLSSQTLYESLLALCDLYVLTDQQKWASMAQTVTSKFVEYQNEDGGFNIGYQFSFGDDLHKSNITDSTTPEVIGVYALYRYISLFEADIQVEWAAQQGIDWILKHAYCVSDDMWAIPYAPSTVSDVHILNGVSFTIGALAAHCSRNPQDSQARDVYIGMLRFLESQLEVDPSYDGMYWPYFYQQGSHLPEGHRAHKIDYYHLGQQLKYHAVAQQLLPSPLNHKIVEHIAKHLADVQMKHKDILPYCNSSSFFKGLIHVWGLASCIKGFTSAAAVLGDDSYLENAKQITDWLMKYAWNGKYFYPILTREGGVEDPRYYPRSDAWVLHSLAHYMRDTGYDEEIYACCTVGVDRLFECNFQGMENHAQTWRSRSVVKLLRFLRKRGLY